MELGVFPAPAVAGILNEMVEARLHLDKPGAEPFKELQLEMTGSYARPIYVVEDPRTGRTVVHELEASFMVAENFARVLQAAIEEVRLAGSPSGDKVASFEAE